MNAALQAILLICFGKLVFSIQDVIIKGISDGYPVHQILVIRGIVALALLVIIIAIRGGRTWFHTRNLAPLLFRGALMFGSFTSYYLALPAMSLTTATVLFFTAPFFITLLSIPMLGEKVGPRRWAGILMGFAGVIIVLRPTGEDFSYYLLLPVVSAFLYSIGQIMVRRLGISENAVIMTFYANLAFVFLGAVTAIVLSPVGVPADAGPGIRFLLSPWTWPDATDLMLMFFTGITAAVGFTFSTQAYRISEVSIVAPFEYVMVVWVTLLSYIVWRETPDLYTILGTAVIVGAGWYVLRRDEIRAKQPLAYKGLTRNR